MSVPASLLPELEDVVQHGSAEKRAETLRRITTLFLDGAARFNDDHVALFDDVIGCLIEEIEVKALAELARRLAPVPNAPLGVVATLAKNDDIAVAGPVLQAGRASTTPISNISPRPRARRICWRCRPAPGSARALSDVLVQRGDGEVARSIATNPKAQLSENAFTDAGQARRTRRRAGREGRPAHRYSAAPVPPIADAGERGGAEAPAGAGQAGNPGRNPPRAGAR